MKLLLITIVVVLGVKGQTSEILLNCRDSFDEKTKLISCIEEDLSESFFHDAFQYFKREFEKVYVSQEEEKKRFDIFKKNYLDILGHNIKKGISYTKKMNKFGDLTKQEFRDQFLFST